MATDIARLAARLADLERRFAQQNRTSSLAYSSIENGALDVYDDSGSLRAVIGQQPDGTTAVNVVNAPPPPAPGPAAVTPALGGVAAAWDGTFADAVVAPLDFARVEIHAAPATDFTPSPTTLRGTLESPQGGTLTIPTDSPLYVRVVARNTSGAASQPSSVSGPAGPAPVVAQEVLDGIVDELALADAAVSRAKIAIGAVDTDRLAIGTGNLLPDGGFEGEHSNQLVAGRTDWILQTPGNASPRCLAVNAAAGQPTTRSLQLVDLPAAPGDRFFLAADYRTSSDWSGASLRICMRWHDAGGATISHGTVEAAPAPGITWTRMSGQVQAPAGTTRATVWTEAVDATRGTAAFDNARVHTVITAGMVLAGSIGTTELAAASITGEKIVAQTITGREIKFGSLTGDHLDVNSARVALLTAGVITATMLKADALNGRTITGELRTADSGSRVEITSVPASETTPSSGRVHLVSGSATEVEPASMYSLFDAVRNTSTLRLQSAVLKDPEPPANMARAAASFPTWPTSTMTMWSDPDASYVEVSATKAIIDASSTYIGTANRTQIEFSGSNINAVNGAGTEVSIYVGGRFIIDPDGWVSRYLETWTTPGIGPGWAQYGGTWDRVAFKVYPDRTVGLRGVLRRTSTAAAAAGEIVLALPANARPTTTYTQQFQALASPSGGAFFLNLNPATGALTLTNLTSAAATALATGTNHLNLSSIRFPLD
ncbi:hypothetical protein [Streptomyces filamentosus]|uniref:hypothetical protein n=1 Tax=Streptomyces filamentosus TaxID=67294 RepID=UPI0034084C9E